MPELPEVETVRKGLQPAMEHKRIAYVNTSDKRLRIPYDAAFKQILQGAEVDKLLRRGKYIICKLQSGYDLILHLGMSGSFRVVSARKEEEIVPLKHDHIIFEMADGMRVIYNDPRRFGFAKVVYGDAFKKYKPFLTMGPEPLEGGFNAAYLKQRLKDAQTSIKQILLDQSIVAGLGNIYVCEALYRAGIHPKRKAGRVSEKRLTVLVEHIKDVLHEAIVSGGSSLKDHKAVDGTMGYFQHCFDVYDREGQICRHSQCQSRNTPCIKRIVQGGRSTFYCSYTQN